MRYLLFSLLSAFCLASLGQNKCTEKKYDDGRWERKCYHQNKKIATEETWDKDERFGKIVGYNNVGELLFEFYLRKVGGHGSVQVQYFANGQVQKIHYSSAPDGGIQWYREQLVFDEQGKLLDKNVEEYPFKPSVFIQFRDSSTYKEHKEKEIKIPIVEQKKVEYISLLYQIRNTTNKKININAQTNANATKEIRLAGNGWVVLDSIYINKDNLAQHLNYKINFSQKKDSKKYEILKVEDIQSTENILLRWILIHK